MEDYFQCVWDLLPFWQDNRHKRVSEPPCKNAEFYLIEEALYGMSGSVVALCSLAVGWQVAKFIWRRLIKQQRQDIEEFDKEQLFRSLCIDAHVAELYKLKTKKWKRNNSDYRRVRKMIRELKSKLRKAHHKEKKHIRKLKRLQKKQYDCPDKLISAKMAELEKRLQGAVHEKEGLTGLLLAAEEKYMARDRNAQEYWFALQMVGRQIQDIKHEASSLRTRLKAFEPQSPRSVHGWAPTSPVYRQQRRNGIEVPLRVRKSQSSPSATAPAKQAEHRVQSVVRNIIDSCNATGELTLPLTSDDAKLDTVVTYSSNWAPGSTTTSDRIQASTQEHFRMRMEAQPPTMTSAALPVRREVYGNANGNATDSTEQAEWPLPDKCQREEAMTETWDISPKPLTLRISPKHFLAASDQKSPGIRACQLESIQEQDRPEVTDTPDSPRTAGGGPTSPLTAYMYPIMDLLGSDTADSLRSSTPPPLSWRDQTGSCPRSDTGNTAATADVEALSAHAEPEPDTLSACVADDTTVPGVPEEGERRRHISTRQSRIPPPRVFSS